MKAKKGLDDLSFTIEHGRFVSALNRVNFDRDLNKILHKGSAILVKHIITHSFIATFVTDLFKDNTRIHKIK